MPICHSCGGEIQARARFCDNCGAPWQAPDSAASAQVISIGRDDDNNIVLPYPMISGRHARILVRPGEAIIEDLGSTNGTSVGRIENKIRRSPLSQNDMVYFGSFGVPASRLLSEKPTVGQNNHSTLAFKGRTMTLGRDPECDQTLDYPMVSWRHAVLTRDGLTIAVEDLGSTNGTFVNGQRVKGKTVVNPGDVISLGSYTFRLTAAGTFEKRDYRGNLTIEARNVTVDVPKKRLIEDVSLTIYPSELVGLMGPSGSGKSTLMMALNGYTPPTHGSVLFNGQDLQENFGQFSGHVGYVPQDDIMHRDLTVRQALYYTARLRLPSDYTDEAIDQRIGEVLRQLGLHGLEDVIIGSPEKKGISGGQRKRVNLAMELLTDPSVLFLDEPTSGLSSEDALMVMKVLKQLANEGKTILITIHQPSLEVFSLMDSLIVISRDAGTQEPGRLVYFGPAYPNSIEFFNRRGSGGGNGRVDQAQASEPALGEVAGYRNFCPNCRNRSQLPEAVLRGLGSASTAEWAKRYANSEYKRSYVDDRAGRRPAESANPLTAKIKRRAGLTQWWTLVKRGMAIKLSDKWGTAILLAQAPIIALLICAVFSSKVGQPESIENWRAVVGPLKITIFLLALAAIWFGCSNSAREIVSEWSIYHRERMINLKIPSYVASKFTVLGVVCMIQCVLLLGIVHIGCGLRGLSPPMYGVLVLSAMIGIGLGLTVSALAKTAETAERLVPIILLPMIMLGCALMPRHEMPYPLLTQPVPSRWAFEALLLMEAEKRGKLITEMGKPVKVELISDGGQGQANSSFKEDMAHDSFPAYEELARKGKKDRSGVKTSVAVLSGMFLTLVIAILIILKRRDIHW